MVRGIVKRLVVLAAIILTLRLTGCMERLFYHPDAAPTPPPPDAEGVWFDSKDGTRLFGWWVPAHSRASAADGVADDLPSTILHVHGNAGNIESHFWFSEHLPRAGFNVFIFDFRGYGQSEGSTWSRDRLIDDTEAALDYVLSRSDVDRDRIAMYGHSLGGSIGLNVMTRRREIRTAVIESAFTSWRDEAACALGGDPPGWLARLLAWVFISDRHRPDEAIALIDRPILILHGTADSIVPVSHGRRLADRAGGQVELVEYADGDHNTLQDTHPESRGAMAEFFRRTLQETGNRGESNG